MNLLGLFDDILIEILSFLNNREVLELSLTSRSVWQRLLNFPNLPNNVLFLLSSLNYYINNADFLVKSKVSHLTDQLPRISSFFLRCHCLMICRCVNNYDKELFSCFRIPHPDCSIEHIQHIVDDVDKFISYPDKHRFPSKVCMTNNSIIFYAFHVICRNKNQVDNQFIYFEFTNGRFFCHQNQLDYVESLQRVRCFKKQFRFLSKDGLQLYSFDCEFLGSYRNNQRINYYGLNEGASHPLHYVSWGSSVDNPNCIFICDLKNGKYYNFILSVNLKFQSPFHITTNNQIIFVPKALNHLNKYELFKYDLATKTLWKMEIDFWKNLG